MMVIMIIIIIYKQTIIKYNNIYNCNIVATQELDKKVIEQENNK